MSTLTTVALATAAWTGCGFVVALAVGRTLAANGRPSSDECIDLRSYAPSPESIGADADETRARGVGFGARDQLAG